MLAHRKAERRVPGRVEPGAGAASQDGYLGQADVATLRALQRPDSHPDAG